MQKVSRRSNPTVTMLETRSEFEWLHNLKKVKPTIRRPVAKLIWWDFFSGRPCTNRAEGFDEYLVPDTTEYPLNKIMNGLIKVGYSREIAKARLSGKGGLIHASKAG